MQKAALAGAEWVCLRLACGGRQVLLEKLGRTVQQAALAGADWVCLRLAGAGRCCWRSWGAQCRRRP